MTVFFCDLVGSSDLAAQLQLEQFRALITGYREECREIVIEHGGHVAFEPGDGILGYFGFPMAHEDDAARAVRTALAITERVRRMTSNGRQLHVRVGIHTGVAAVGDPRDPRAGDDILGQIPNDAADLQGHAEEDTVLISEATWSLVAGHFEVEDLGSLALKGGGVHAYRVLREKRGVSRFDASVLHRLTPLTGRDEERRLLQKLWKATQSGGTRALLVCGEAGIGKSRLLGVAREAALAAGSEVILAQCSAEHVNSPFHPIAEALERRLDLSRLDAAADRLTALREYLEELQLPAETAIPLLAPLLGVRLDEPDGRRVLTPTRRVQETLTLLITLIERIAGGAPVLILIEDLHWADPSTLDLLNAFLNGEIRIPCLVAMTTRAEPEAIPALARRSTVLRLQPLGLIETRALVAGMVGNRKLPEEVLHDIILRTGGVPLFTEAVTRTVLESGHLQPLEHRYELSHPLPPGLIPPTIHASLLARIDALGDGPARRIIQLAATLGREFTLEDLRGVSRHSERELGESLEKMVQLTLVSGGGPDGRYSFTHALVQDAAYQSLLSETRRDYHEAIAAYLALRNPEIGRDAPELLARHLEGAERTSEAIDYWLAAGEQAGQRSAVRECVGYLRRALRLLDELREGDPDRTHREMVAQLALAPALMATNGWASREVEKACLRAQALCERTGNGQGLIASLWGLWTVRFVRGELDPALETAEAVLEMARASGDPLLLVAACQGMAFTHYFRGEFTSAQRYAEEGLEHFDLDRERLLLRLFQLPPSLCCLLVLAQCLRFGGSPEAAARRHREMGDLVEALANPAATIVCLGIGMYYDFDRRDVDVIERKSTSGYSMSVNDGFELWEGGMQVYHGWALSMRGKASAGLAEIRAGLRSFEQTESRLTLSAMHFMLAEALLAQGRGADALAALQAARELVDALNERYFEAEIHRLQGESLIAVGAEAEGEAELRAALEIAHLQGARLLELRAAIPLARRLMDLGRTLEAGELLLPLRESFTEGFDETELIEADRLLELCEKGER